MIVSKSSFLSSSLEVSSSSLVAFSRVWVLILWYDSRKFCELSSWAEVIRREVSLLRLFIKDSILASLWSPIFFSSLYTSRNMLFYLFSKNLLTAAIACCLVCSIFYLSALLLVCTNYVIFSWVKITITMRFFWLSSEVIFFLIKSCMLLKVALIFWYSGVVLLLAWCSVCVQIQVAQSPSIQVSEIS